MFNGRAIQSMGGYEERIHLEETEALFRPFPSSLLMQANQDEVRKYFDEDGCRRDPIPNKKPALENWIESLADKDKVNFVAFLKSMKINPDDRKMAKESLDEPWL